MANYRISTSDGVEIAVVEARGLIDAIGTPAAYDAPLLAEVVPQGCPKIFARKEQWMGEYPGWSLITVPDLRIGDG